MMQIYMSEMQKDKRNSTCIIDFICIKSSFLFQYMFMFFLDNLSLKPKDRLELYRPS